MCCQRCVSVRQWSYIVDSLSISIKGDKEREGWEGESRSGWRDGVKGGGLARREVE